MSFYSSACLLVSSATLLLVSFGSCSDGQVNAQKPRTPAEAKADQLLTLMGMREMVQQQYERTFAELQRMPGLDAKAIDKLREMTSSEQMLEIVAGVYVKHLDEPTLDAVIEFAGSPAGRTWFARSPQIQQESVAASMRWAQQLTEKLK